MRGMTLKKLGTAQTMNHRTMIKEVRKIIKFYQAQAANFNMKSTYKLYNEYLKLQ